MNSNVKKAKKVKGITGKVTPQSYPPVIPQNELSPRVTPQQGGNQGIIEKAERLYSEGWVLRVKLVKGKKYLYARRYNKETKSREEIYVGSVSEEEIKVLEEKGLLRSARKSESKSRNIGSDKRGKRKPQQHTTTRHGVGGGSSHEGVGGHGGGSHVCGFMVHRLGLRFVKPWVSPLLLRQLGGVRFVERSRQWVVRLGVGRGRWVTLQVNGDGTAQVFLEASGNPLSVEEFIGFCRFFLLELFRRVTGRDVSLRDFMVVAAPEINCDFGGVRVLEGVKCLTLEDYYGEVVRVYWCGAGSKVTMPNGGTRVEVRAESLKGAELGDVVDGLVGVAKLPLVVNELRSLVGEVRGYLQGMEDLHEEVRSLVLLMGSAMERLAEVSKLMSDVAGVLGIVVGKVAGVAGATQNVRQPKLTFRDLPKKLRDFLMKLEEDGYVRITEERVAYGDRVWGAIRRLKGNIDGWMEWESLNYGSKSWLFKAVLRAVRYYDNRYGGKPGVPWGLFVEILKQYVPRNKLREFMGEDSGRM